MPREKSDTERKQFHINCEAGGSPDEARLEQTPYPFQPHYLALFRHKITLYRFNQGAHTIAGGLKWEQKGLNPQPPHFNHCSSKFHVPCRDRDFTAP